LGLQSIPAFILIASRSLIGGGVLLLLSYFRGSELRPLGDWGHAAVGGAFLFMGCHGALAYAQRQVPSGLSAVLLATIPFWIVLVNVVIARSEPLGKLLGLLPGFAGVALIAWHETSSSTRPLTWTMMLVLLASALSWAVGSVYSQRRAAHIPSDQLAGMQLICGGGGLLILSTIAGEWIGFTLANVTVTSIACMLYLALLGSVVGNTAYLWLLDRMAAPIVATCTFVNPVIALLLGWWVLSEQVTWISLCGAALVVSSIVMLLSHAHAAPERHPSAPTKQPIARPCNRRGRVEGVGRTAGIASMLKAGQSWSAIQAIGFDRAQLSAIDEWRRRQTPIPSVSEAIRLLIDKALSTTNRSESKKTRK
jgi:drug/metabolite transporter (DMT)-like permease